ncbi:pyridoxamine 5'-phosphate oxidase family protein [Telmatospirillum sp. J64-1]|uniref:pyridoxamine 5'-phosphate oxidase family protein n=1 Tax=Telmatospirillum sp. J64-1 TaxID=2502183 RepID=UPI00115F67EF|nr:pyridoxamine 5'-phosphate oxidase family protein [Telmatospirillum sp. J64-1]
MTIRLRDLAACFDGVIPSIIATAAHDGTPNISYLSHVQLVDDEHVALSNQFFSKTAANVQANPAAALLVVDARNGEQYRLDVRFERSVESGELFEEMAVQLRAASAQIGMADIMRLRGIDIYRVGAIRHVPSPKEAVDFLPAENPLLSATAEIVRRISQETEIGAIIDAALDGLRDELCHAYSMALLMDPAGERLVTIGSRGYDRTGIGSEVAIGDGLIGLAAAERRPIRVSDMSRVRRFGSAIRISAVEAAEENRTRTIQLPGLPEAMSQMALPMVAHGLLRGILFVESPKRFAFTREDQAALAIIAAQAAGAIVLAESEAVEAAAAMAIPLTSPGRQFQVIHHPYDDSVFIENEYIIKGVAGRLLVHLLRLYLREGRTEFTNREIRFAPELRLPDYKDNLETRLLLLRRRLEDKATPIQLIHVGRGRISLAVAGAPVLNNESG